MARLRWLKWGLIFSIVLFAAMYFILYKKIIEDPVAVLRLGNWDVSFLRPFFSEIKNVILTSLIAGFFFGLLTVVRFKKSDE
jgi:hypothetical protein